MNTLKNDNLRLFISVNFNQSILSMIKDAQRELRRYTDKANFISSENIHMTLAFIGETTLPKVGVIKQVLNRIKSESFEIRTGEFGSFKRGSSELIWLSIPSSDALESLSAEIVRGLLDEGIHVDTKPFTPHVTLARNVTFKNREFEIDLPVQRMSVDKIDLMNSELGSGKPIYTSIYQASLKGAQ